MCEWGNSSFTLAGFVFFRVADLTFSFLPRRARVPPRPTLSTFISLTLVSYSRAVLHSVSSLGSYFSSSSDCLRRGVSFATLPLCYVSDHLFLHAFDNSLLLIPFIFLFFYFLFLAFSFYHRFSKVVCHSNFSFIFFLSFRLFPSLRPSLIVSRHPPHFPDSRSLARPAVSAFRVYVFFFARSRLPYSRFISFFRHLPLR